MIRITEIFHSIQGESTSVGEPTVFVRLTGCPLRCRYCDTSYAFSGGQQMSVADIAADVAQYSCQYVTVTGGEPLAQPKCLELLRVLVDAGYRVSLETSGAIDVSTVDPRVRKIVDIKTPGSGEQEKNLLQNLSVLSDIDELKFVICDRDDYRWSKNFLEEHQISQQTILLSPSHDELDGRKLAEWILEDRLQVRLQLQAHKYLWGNEPGR